MRKNLLAMLLAVVMIAAVVFIAAPNAKAADAPTVITAEAGKTIELTADAIVNLNGLKNVVIDTKGYKVSLVDTGNLDDLSGDAAGTAKVTGTVADWVQHTGGFKYLALENADGTYSAHPFNISITEYGVNTHYSAVSVRVTVIANDKVAKLIDAGEFGLHNYNLANTKNADKEYSPYWKSFKDFTNEDGKYTTHGIHGYFYLENSLTSDVLTDNLFAQVGAYIKIGNLTVESNTKVDIYPKTILTDLNKKVIDEPTLFTEDQKAKMVELLNKEGNDYLKAYCGNFLPAEPVYVWELVKDASALTVGDKIVIVAMGSNYALSTTQNNNNRAQAAVTKGDNIITFGDDVQVLTLEAGKVANTFAFNTGSGYLYAASSGSNYLKTKNDLDNNGSWTIEIDAKGVATIKAQGTNTRNWLRYNSSSSLFSCYSSGQADVVIYKKVALCDHKYNTGVATAPTCGKDGYITKTCTLCGNITVVPDENNPATGNHSYTSVETAPTCTKDGYITKTCSVCGDVVKETGKEKTGHTPGAAATCTAPQICTECETVLVNIVDHNYVGGKCSGCGKDEPSGTATTTTLSIFANKGTLSGTTITWTSGNIIFKNEKDKSSNAIRTSDSDHFRVYAGSKVTISTNDGAKITKIVITCTGSSYAKEMQKSIGSAATVSGSTVTVTLSGDADSFTFSATAQIRLKKIAVTSVK